MKDSKRGACLEITYKKKGYVLHVIRSSNFKTSGEKAQEKEKKKQ